MLVLVVNRGLEGAIIGDLADGAPSAASLPPPRQPSAVSPMGADLIVCAPTDLPTVRAVYCTAGLWPSPVAMIGSAGAPAGTAIVTSRSAISVEASDPAFMVQVRPALMGQDVCVLRYGFGRSRMQGAVATVDLTTP